MFCNFCHLSLEQLDTFNVDTGLFEIPPYQEGEDYKIGKYEMSPYYVNYLSDEIIQLPGVHTDTVQNQTLWLSLNAKSAFHSAFKMPLYMVEALVARIVEGGIVKLSHHCWTAALLKIKSELLVLGALAILSGTKSGFRNLCIATHICATEHSKFFNSLTAMWRQDAAFFNELRARVITPRIFGRF